MNVKIKAIIGTWRDVADSARTTINMDEGTKEPTSKWKKNMLLAEHSPIRRLKLNWKWYELMRFVSDHFVRHKIGIEHWVKTDRTDRTGIDRKDLSQCSLTTHECEATAQALITISRKRLCKQASTETTEAWKEFLNGFKDDEPELFSVCVPECIYRGFCPELKSCGYTSTKDFEERLTEYRRIGDV